MDYIISKWGEETVVLPLNLVKKIILDPRNMEKRYNEMLMYVSGVGFSPAHLPHFSDILKWISMREDKPDTEDREFLHTFGP